MAFTSTFEFISVQPETKLHVVRTSPTTKSRGKDTTSNLTLIFLHFWGGSSNTWESVIPLIANQYPTLALDFRGWGQSTGPDNKDAYSTSHLANDVEAIVTHYKLQNFTVIGHSMGAKVAQVVAGRCNVKGLCGLALVAPSPPTPFVLPGAMREQQIHAYDSPQSAEFVARNVLSAGSLSDAAVGAVVEDALRGGQWATVAWPGYAMAEDALGFVGGIKIPVFVCAGGKDIVEPVDRVEKDVCGNIKGATMTVLQDSGHLMPLEVPDELGRHILDFVKSLE